MATEEAARERVVAKVASESLFIIVIRYLIETVFGFRGVEATYPLLSVIVFTTQ